MFITRRTFLSTSMLAVAGLAACSAPQTPTPSSPVILASGLDFPEGPAFAPDGSLWCTEMGKGNLIRMENGKVRRIPVNGRPNSLAFDRQGRAWVPDSQNNQIRRYDPANNTWDVLLDAVDGQPLQAPNDLSFDSKGNLIFTCPNFASQEKTGYVACLAEDGTAQIVGQGYYRPNGLDLLDSGKTLVVADTFQKTLFRGAWNASERTWLEPQPWIQVGGAEGPDGMAPGDEGRLYCAIFGDGVVRVIDPTGKISGELALPGKNPTNAALDPSGKLGLIVTETETGTLLSLPWITERPSIFTSWDPADHARLG